MKSAKIYMYDRYAGLLTEDEKRIFVCLRC